MRLKVYGRHLKFKFPNKYLNGCERLEVLERNTDDPLSSLTVCKSSLTLKESPNR